MAIERYQLIPEPGRNSGGGVFWVVIVLIVTLVGLVIFNGGTNFRPHQPSRFDFNAAEG